MWKITAFNSKGIPLVTLRKLESDEVAAWFETNFASNDPSTLRDPQVSVKVERDD